MNLFILLILYCSHGYTNSYLLMSINSNIVHFLSSKLSNLIQKEIKNDPDYINKKDSTGNHSTNSRIISYPLTFHIHNKQKVKLIDPIYGKQYLELPVSSYSLLDTSLIQRLNNTYDNSIITNRFQLNIPLQSYFSKNDNDIILPKNIFLNFDVNSNIKQNSIQMNSSEIYLQFDNISNTMNYTKGLPQWLIYGGFNNTNLVNIMKSSIQLQSNIELIWPSSSIIISNKTNSFLPLDIITHLYFDFNIPIIEKYHRILSILPIKVLIRQLSIILIDQILRIIINGLLPKFIDNYETFKKNKQHLELETLSNE